MASMFFLSILSWVDCSTGFDGDWKPANLVITETTGEFSSSYFSSFLQLLSQIYSFLLWHFSNNIITCSADASPVLCLLWWFDGDVSPSTYKSWQSNTTVVLEWVELEGRFLPWEYPWLCWYIKMGITNWHLSSDEGKHKWIWWLLADRTKLPYIIR
jgi:hypothetical protein